MLFTELAALLVPKVRFTWWPVVAAAVSAYGAFSANRESQKYGRDMSGTAHQREVADLRAAGLNPILSGTGGQGASTPQAQFSNIGEAASSSYMAARANKAQVDLTRKQQQLTEQQYETEWERTGTERANKARAQVDATYRDLELAREKLRWHMDEPTWSAKADIASAKAEATGADIERGLDESSGELMRTLRRLGLNAGSAAGIMRLLRPESGRSARPRR